MSEFQSNQSNSPFPTSNFFNPRLPLVRYGFPSLYPAMSSQEHRTLWCLLKDDTYAYDIYIGIDANVNQLKSAIKERIECLDGTNPDCLQLRKLNVAVPIGPDYSLAQRLETLDLATCSQALSSEEQVGELFPEPHSKKQLHIVVQLSAIRKRLRSPAEEDGRAAKRKEIEEVSETQGGVSDIRTRCTAIHEAIKALDDLDLSNPLTFKILPFPSLLSMPTQRFEQKEINGIDHFEYMGRSHFHELQERVKNRNFLRGSESLYLYGTSGSGKSHLLAALVYHLVRKGERVIYIPDCSVLYLDPAQVIWTALNFAFYDSAVLGTIDRHSVDAMIHFMSKHQDLYVIVDQVNALETTGIDDNMKAQARALLGTMRFKHRYIFSASANENSNREADRKQSRISVFRIFGGMTKEETDQWFIYHDHQIPQLSAEQRQRVEYITGRIPLLLRCLLNINNFVELEFRDIVDLRNVTVDVEKFFRAKLASLLNDALSKERYLTIMRECVRDESVTSDDRSLYDLRYFYVDEKGIGRFTCGLALERMMSMLRICDDAPFLDDLWYAAVARSGNPVVQGFLAEQICLSTIATKGLKAVNPKLGQMSTASFSRQPAFNAFLLSDHNICLYVPNAYNFKTVDGVILLLDRASKQATMFPIQFTLSQNHKQSDKEFHTQLWPSWIEPITAAGFSVQSTFVWIDKKQPSEHVELKLVRVLRSGDREVHPEYTVVHVGVKMVDSRLASVLGIKQ
ncbi:hypothetical protein JOM56_002202 [Amanita muscaria]